MKAEHYRRALEFRCAAAGHCDPGHAGAADRVASVNDDEAKRELAALLTRAGVEEAKRQSALARGDYLAAREFELEISRLHSRAVDIERQHRAA